MSKRIFNEDQIESLRRNVNVDRCSERSISYNRDFKIRAIKQYNEEGLGTREIFELAGFNIEIIGRDAPRNCLKDWNKIYKRKGLTGLQINSKVGRSGRPKKNELEGKDKIERLEMQVEYLKAENDFLVKLRAKRAK